MNEKIDKFVEELSAAEYVPNPLVGFLAFKEKNKAKWMHEADKSVKSLFNGFLLLSITVDDNSRINNLVDALMSMDEHPIFQNNTLETITKSMAKKNMFGVTEDDFVTLLAKADATGLAGNLDDAIDMFHALTLIFPLHIESWMRWGHFESKRSNDLKKVLPIYEACLKLFDHPSVYAAIGICYARAKDFKMAETYFYKGITLCNKTHDMDLKADLSALLAQMKGH